MKRQIIIEMIILAGAVIVCPVQAGSIIYVDVSNSAGPWDGSADHPFGAIQDGINASVDDDEVVVADGTYTGAGNTNLNFGGRLITLRSENGRDNCIIDCQGSVLAFTFENGETEQAVLDGFTIQNGYHWFGGMRITTSNPTIIGCRFIGSIGTGAAGGMYMINSTSRIEDCEFITNSCYIGNAGGLYVGGGGPSIINCLFAENFAGGRGGGMFAESTNLTLTGCKFMGNKQNATPGGGGLYCLASNVTMTDCMFGGNYSPFSGAGIYCHSSSITASGCSFVGNYAAGDDFEGRWGGGGMFVAELSETQQVLIQNCIFSGNLAKAAGGGIFCMGGSSVSVANSLFAGNECYHIFGAGGITSRDQAEVAASNCTFADNGGDYGSVYGWPAVASISNCILWNGTWSGEAYAASVLYSNVRGGYAGEGNISVDPGFSVDVSGAWTADAVYDSAAYTVICTDDNASWQSDELAGLFIYPGGSPRMVYPIITNTTTTVTIHADWQTIRDGVSAIKAGWSYNIRDYHLASDSPCIDAGDPDFVRQSDETDFDGFARLVDGNCDGTPRVDMGAYEFSYASMGDFDRDCHVGLLDFGFISSAWMTGPDDPAFNRMFDISVPKDQTIDVGDLATLADHWLANFGN